MSETSFRRKKSSRLKSINKHTETHTHAHTHPTNTQRHTHTHIRRYQSFLFISNFTRFPYFVPSILSGIVECYVRLTDAKYRLEKTTKGLL